MAPNQPLRVAGRSGPPAAFVAPILGLAAVGALVMIPLLALAAIPLLLAALIAVGGVVAFVLSLWALIEGLAALERWMESDRRFQQ